MSFKKPNQRAGTVLGLALVLAAFAPPVLAQCPSSYLTDWQAMQRARPCECHPGIEQIENLLKDTTSALNAWQQVYQMASQQTMTPDQVRASFNAKHKDQIDHGLFGCSMRGKIGKTAGQLLCRPCVRQDIVDCTCDAIVLSIILHENMHCFYNLNTINIVRGLFDPGKVLAGSEVQAHEWQQEDLQAELDRLRNSAKCKPKLSYYPTPQGGAGQPAFASAANRVGQYAAAID